VPLAGAAAFDLGCGQDGSRKVAGEMGVFHQPSDSNVGLVITDVKGRGLCL
jgi:hypothetical protein